MQDPVIAPEESKIDYEREYYRLTDENCELRAKVAVLENAIICDFVKRAGSKNTTYTR